MEFRESDIVDKERLERMVEKEAQAIFQSDVSRKGRDLDTIRFVVKQSKIAELWLIENEGYEESDIKWHDLKRDDEYTEVKAYTGVWSKDAPFVEKDIRRLRTETWSKSKWYMLFKVDSGTYTLLDTIQIQ
jgi:hypothetical protein